MARRGRPAPGPVTLSSDVGSVYAAEMKAVLLAAVGPGRVVDLSHELRPHDVVEGAFLLRAMAAGFPPGSVHVAVVDPGVGGPRAPLVLACADGSNLVGPDNGILVPLAEALGGFRAYRLDARKLERADRVGTTFDGRDLFAPAAALLACGVPARSLGTPTEILPSPIPVPHRTPERLVGTIVHVDRFGNAVSNVPTSWVPRGVDRLVLTGGTRRRLLPWTTHYGSVARGRPVALGSSFGTVEFACREAPADRRLGLATGTAVTIRWRVRHTTGK